MAELKLPFIGHGGDYNPDQWRDRPDILAEDIRLMKLATCNLMSVGIFAWATLEHFQRTRGVLRLMAAVMVKGKTKVRFELSGYSISTVSRVLNNRADVSEKAREKIEKVIRELNYQPNENARMLKQTVSSDISVIVRGNKSIFLESILEEIQIRMGKHGESVNVQFIGETDDEVATAV